ncbi:Fanconi anemia group B protein isoform 1-T2 [Anomaloglossus baeobatrachus]|uniref:Fanconi anemia group B protein n=1 Tax=Anomaloglossus baeobatrachus TaxID=238106 RepID=UPI003F505F35
MELASNNGLAVAHNGQIITFHVLQRKNSDSSEKNVLAFSRKTFSAEAGQFVDASGGEYNVPSCKSVLELACVRCVADARSGLRLPCVLLRTCKRKSSGFFRLILLLLHSSNELEPYSKFKVNSETMDDLTITDGPTVLWRQQETLRYVSSLTSEVFTAPINISALLWAGTVEEGTCILGITSMRLDGEHLTSSSPNSTLQGKEFILYCIENQKAVPGSCLVPHVYSSVLRCLEVCVMQNVNGRYETSAIAASSKQLIWFHNGVPKQVCQLPAENPSKLQVAYTSQADILCVLSSSGDACAIWRDGWKTAATWKHVRNILVDDFIGIGSDQILLLFNYDPSDCSEQRPFTLTNCGDISYPADRIDDDVVGFQENHFLMLPTLEARLQANVLSLEDLQRHIQVQEGVLESSCDALVHMSLGVETSVPSAGKEGLVSLWDDVEDCPHPPAADGSPPVRSEQLVEATWHCVVDDLLVVGVRLKSSVLETLSDIGLSLIMDGDVASPSPVTKCQTNVLKLAISSSQDSRPIRHTEPSAKRQRLDLHSTAALTGERSQRPCPPSYQDDLERTVTAVTELSPLLARNHTACALLLHARRKTQPDCLLRGEKLIVPCGSVSLSLEDVLKGKRTINVFEHCQGSWSLEDIFAVLSAFKKCSLHILSQDYTIPTVTEWMRAHMYGEPLRQMPEMMVCKKDGSLHGTLLTWNPKTPCEGTLTVYYRNDAVLLQCLHSLKCVLPPTCAVNVKRQGDRNSMTMNLAQSVEEELLALRNLVSAAESEVEKDLTLNCKAEEKVTSPTDSVTDIKEQVQKYREDLRAERAHVRLGAHLSASSELYRHNMLRIVQLQMNSDALACEVANR